MTDMKKGEVAIVAIQPEYAFGSSGLSQELAVVPPNSTVHYEIELVSFEKVEKESWDMSTQEKSTLLGRRRKKKTSYLKVENVRGPQNDMRKYYCWYFRSRRCQPHQNLNFSTIAGSSDSVWFLGKCGRKVENFKFWA